MSTDAVTVVASVLASTLTIITILKVSINAAKEELKGHITQTMLEHIRLEHLPPTKGN